jgi:uncharacterized protein
MNKTWQKTAAVIEVILVIFGLVPFLTLGINRLFPGFESWQTDTLGFPFPIFIYIVMISISVLAILVRRKKLADYGIHLRELKYQLDIALACFIPVALSDLPLGMGVNYKTWSGAGIMAVVNLGLLLLLGGMLRKKKVLAPVTGAAAWIVLWPAVPTGAQVAAGKLIVIFFTYALFVGFGEEILYRGYMQTRLNEVFDKPYHFFDVSIGWGTLLAALLFGLTHVGILRWIVGLDMQVTAAWGFWTAFSGLVFGFVREKSGGILAPALLHGMPQAIAEVAFLFI